MNLISSLSLQDLRLTLGPSIEFSRLWFEKYHGNEGKTSPAAWKSKMTYTTINFRNDLDGSMRAHFFTLFRYMNRRNRRCHFKKEVDVVHRGRYINNKCIIVCLTM